MIRGTIFDLDGVLLDSIMGMYLGIGLALSFTYIMLQTVSATFAINANTPPMLAAWIPNTFIQRKNSCNTLIL